MTKSNRLLGQFELSNLPPAPRGVPQIEVSFDVDANGILSISACDKASGKTESITITSEKGRLSEDEIERMVREAEEFAEEDKLAKERVEAKNQLEGYLYNLKNSINEQLQEKLQTEDKETLTKTVDDALVWLEDNPAGEKGDYEKKQKEVEDIVNPILKKAYAQKGDSSGPAGDDDFLGEDLDGVGDGPNIEEAE